MSVWRPIAGTALTRLLTVGIMLGASILVARALGPGGRGVVAYLVLVASVPLLLCGLGLEASWQYLLRQRPEQQQAILGTARSTAGVVGLLAALGSGLWLVLDPRETAREYPVACLLVLVIPLVAAPAGAWRSFLLAQLRFREVNLADLTGKVIYLLAILGLFLLGRLWVPEAMAAALLLQAATLLALVLALRPRGWPRFSREVLGAGLDFGRWAYLATLATFLLYHVDKALLIWMRDEVELGLYALAVVIGEQLWHLAAASGLVNFPVAAGRQAGDTDHTPRLCRLNVLALLILGAALALAAPLLVPLLYGVEFTRSATILLWLLPGLCAAGVAKVLASDLAGRGRVRQNCAASATALVANVILNLLLIPPLGAVGAALATSISYALAFVLLLHDYRRQSGYTLRQLLVIQRRDLAGLLAWIRRQAVPSRDQGPRRGAE